MTKPMGPYSDPGQLCCRDYCSIVQSGDQIDFACRVLCLESKGLTTEALQKAFTMPLAKKKLNLLNLCTYKFKKIE